jgi:pimeloyl-ACP methyl ester carboxylesterase
MVLARCCGDAPQQGHRVTTPTLTGLGERRHLMSRDIVLETFVADVLNHIEAEELNDVILVGHSHAGATITGVADRIPEKIRHLGHDAMVLVPDHLTVTLGAIG